MNKVTILFILLFSGFLFSQETDSTLFRPKTGPTLDSLAAKTDTSAVKDTTKKKSDIDAVIYASGSDSLIFKIPERQMQIFGNGELKYKKTELKSADILVDFDLSRIQAWGVVDTSDTAKTKLKGTPVMSEAGEIYEGNRLTYDFKTQRGIISVARSKAEGGYYGGSRVKKIDKETYFIKNGTYTTCDADSAHYFFYAKEMKVIMKEQIIARWIWLYIGGVPLPIPLPFGVFPNESGRRSGIIAPAYGQSFEYGQYFSHLGYFWAISDYMDVNLLSDLYLRGGYNLSSRFRYAKRYSLSGSIDGGYSSLHTGESGDPDYGQKNDWRIGVYHNQQIDPTMRLDANLNYMSSKGYLNRTSFNYNELLSQNIRSSATLSKTWEASGNSMTIGYSRDQIIDSPDSSQIGNINEILPSVNFTMLPTYPFKKKGKVDPSDEKWYEQIGINYSGQFQNVRTKLSGNLSSHGGFLHSLSTNIAPKIGYFNVSPRFNYVERWYNKRIEREDFHVIDRARSTVENTVLKDSIVTREVHELDAVRSFDLGLEASTKLYGIIQPNILGIQAMRHTITPRISYTYTPDFSGSKWGYYGTYTDVAGNRVKYSKYEREVFQGPGAYEQQNLNFSVNNIFEIKTDKDPSDTTSEAKKIQLLNLDAGLSYNFAAPVNKLSDLLLSYRTQVGDYFSFNGSSSYSFYDFDYNKGTTSTSYLASRKGGGFMRLTNFQFSISTSISAERLKGKDQKKEEKTVPPVTESAYGNRNNPYMGIYSDEPPDYSIPWDLALNFNYSMDKRDPREVRKYSNMSTSFNFSLTESIKLAFTGSYDFKQKVFTAPQVRIYKDLHCWEMNLSWNPLGVYRGYRFEIRVKAPQLQDIKLERSRGQFSGR